MVPTVNRAWSNILRRFDPYPWSNNFFTMAYSSMDRKLALQVGKAGLSPAYATKILIALSYNGYYGGLISLLYKFDSYRGNHF